MAVLVPFAEALRLDAELVRFARGASALRIALGDALDALATAGGHHELGFSSLEAYARERCERTGRRVADTRALSRKLASLPQTRAALEAGSIGWSTAELLARHVDAQTEGTWLENARNVTVRELRLLLTGGACSLKDEDEDEPTRKLTVSANHEDGCLFECARKVAEAVGGPMTSECLFQSLLAEGYSTLFELVPDCSALHELDEIECDVADESEAFSAWCADRQRWRDEAEATCETQWASCNPEGNDVGLGALPREKHAQGVVRQAPEALDRIIRRLCSELSERDLALGIVAENARKAEVWRRLGFATEIQYARERVGVSLSSLKAKRTLAARTVRVPELGAALSSGRVGYEAAYLLSRVVTPKTVEEWLRRAEQRTVKHLKEEIEAVEVLIRMGHGRDQLPLDEQSLDTWFELDRWIMSGDLFGRAANTWAGEGTGGVGSAAGQMSGDHSVEREAGAGRDGAGQTSGARRAVRLRQRFGRVTLRWNVTEKTYRFFRALERVFVRVRSRVCRGAASFLRFLCENFCRIWLPVLRQRAIPAYFSVYRRDVFRCTSPVCTRRDVTPHHLRFRSHGGGDEDENVASLCVWCHLHGVHEGRIAADPPASKISWRIGRRGTLWVEGRTRA